MHGSYKNLCLLGSFVTGFLLFLILLNFQSVGRLKPPVFKHPKLCGPDLKAVTSKLNETQDGISETQNNSNVGLDTVRPAFQDWKTCLLSAKIWDEKLNWGSLNKLCTDCSQKADGFETPGQQVQKEEVSDSAIMGKEVAPKIVIFVCVAMDSQASLQNALQKDNNIFEAYTMDVKLLEQLLKGSKVCTIAGADTIQVQTRFENETSEQEQYIEIKDFTQFLKEMGENERIDYLVIEIEGTDSPIISETSTSAK
ncbi:unnamed protein product [Caenorhabditis auriculariae]|uniref:Uncharacterized protein n=1 Tax=Caenorhabditis auriculariae TaxID=2777116 RepID=A0A8S1H813_9PELO|nr:unnamed protein product [Caenorhabditis auriculariae]